ncbi:hypothetical protein P7K49_018987 [Saguinus oedipus]|uniref:Uncharacterized protein n=1 Tax=Saguinus oedipus TaxID=9490 RepID=A0ABQ9UW39_SAGOE|nr:hypothetical protein P7K49_018987 [Saguinus oedipus]
MDDARVNASHAASLPSTSLTFPAPRRHRHTILLKYLPNQHEQDSGLLFAQHLYLMSPLTVIIDRTYSLGTLKLLSLEPSLSQIDLEWQFGGYAKEADYVAHASRLRAALEGTAAYRGDIYFCTGYDPPMKPYGRRNEIWLLKT